MYLIVGLGNIGKEYEHTRHNMGFDVVDAFAESLGEDINKDGFKGKYNIVNFKGEKILLLKPSTFMNNSGQSVIEAINYFKIPLENMIIVYDEMDFAPGKMKLKENGSSGGHNGIKSIIQYIKTSEFKRVRVGIGKPQFNVIDFVLSKPSKEEQKLIEVAQENAVSALKLAISESFPKAMSIYNNK